MHAGFEIADPPVVERMQSRRRAVVEPT